MKRSITTAELDELRSLCARSSELTDELTAIEDKVAALLNVREGATIEYDHVVDGVWSGDVDRLLELLSVRVQQANPGREVGT